MFHFNHLQLTSTPAFAGRDFLSGAIYGQFGADIKADADLCVPDNADITKITEDLLTSIKDEDWETEKDLDSQLEAAWEKELEADWMACSENFQSTFEQVDQFYKDFMAQENYEDLIMANMKQYAHEIDGYAAQMIAAWEIGKYYEAGKLAGVVDSYIFKMPEFRGDTLVFTQTGGMDKFLLDTTGTFCDPAYPVKGTTAKFTVAGTWLMPETLVDVEFKVLMNGTPLADLPEADAETVAPGAPWSKEFDFPVPGFAPSGTYDVTVSARDADKNHLFDVQTSFIL